MRWCHSLSLITMDSQLSSSTTRHVFLFCILIGLINMPPCYASTLYEDCSNSFNCGNINVTYPFWGDNRAYDCGYDQLKLTCENGMAKISIASVKYRLLNYYDNTQVMQIARDDYATNGLCSPNYTNTTLDPVLFELANGYLDFSLIYGCPANAFAFLSCPVSGTSNTGGYATLGAVGPTLCSVSVVVPVYSQGLDPGNINSSSIIENILKRGFEVRLKVDAPSCNGCIESKGVCGYDHSANKTTCYYPATADAPQGQSTNGSIPRKWIIISIVCAAIILLGIIATVLMIWFCKQRRSSFYEDNNNNVEVIINSHGFLTPKRYKYSELKKITNSFMEKIGQGGYGTVYKGKLLDGQLVAVKLLTKSKPEGHGEEFINEVASISRTSHVNVVNLLGFCYERNRRALIYKFMPNGSLDQFIPPEGALHTSLKIDWKILHQIVLGIARGLEYLHRGCTTRILHFDIKPQNILLDEDLIPKISDFGLAKLCLGKESIVSLLDTRGTIGYIAPEVFSRNFGRVSHKSDVYSYGMLVLAMVCGKSINNDQVSHSSDLYFPHSIYKQLKLDIDFKFQGIVTHEEEEIARKLMLIGFWCIQTNPSHRPSITNVIDMLEGSLHSIDMPPEPFLSNPMSLPRSLAIAIPSFSSNTDNDDEDLSFVVNRILGSTK